MTNSNQIESVAGVSEGSICIDEMISVPVPSGNSLSELGNALVSSIEWSLSSKADTYKSTKYPGSENVIYYGSGAFSMNPLLGRFIFGALGNEPSSPLMKLDRSSSSLNSTANNTTLGSKNIDTKDGFYLNQIGAKYPSTHFTPQKTWLQNIFPSFNSDLLKLSVLEAIQVLLVRALKKTSSEQIIQPDRKDLGTIIVDNQEIEDRILKRART